uniref:glutathione peroxidase n=1 Tax=Mus spicilegus TaxID=10103 RepID=A0A8C6IAY5_MUSSI
RQGSLLFSMAYIAKSFYDLSAIGLDGEKLDFNTFRGRENCQNEEILNSLKYVRPGVGTSPPLNEHPVFAYLKDKLPYPYDDPFSLMTDPRLIIWSPVHHSDVSWNFEKFLIGPEGEPFCRYSRSFQTINIEPDIKRLLKVAI